MNTKILIVLLIVVVLAGIASAVSWTKLEDPIAINNLGYWAYQQGELGIAEKLFTKALELKPDYTKARENLAITLNTRGRYAAAAAELETLLSSDGNNVQYWYDLGVNRIASFRSQRKSLDDFYAGYDAYAHAAQLDADYAHVQENLAVLDAIKAEFGI